MKTKSRALLALLMLVMLLAGGAGPSVEAAWAAPPRIPVPHEPPRLPHLPRGDLPEPPVVEPRVVPPEGTVAFETLKQRRVAELKRRYAQVLQLVPYACAAKNMSDLARAESVEDAAQQIALDIGGDATFVLRVVGLANDMKNQSDLDQVRKAAVFSLCEAMGGRL
jgi:hypothetical protein